MKKYLIFFTFLFFIILSPRIANAQITHLYLFDANFNQVVHTTSDCWTSNDAVDVRYGRFVFDDALAANTPYTLNFQIGQTSYNKYVGFYWNGSSGINANGGYLKTSPTAAATLSQSVISGSPSIYQKSSSFTFDIKTNGASSNTFFQMDFGSYTLIRQFCLNSWSIAQGSSSSSDIDSQSIINNNNQNTQIIVNNNNQNTQNIVDSQQETTDAINDVNDTLNDSNVNGAKVIGNDILEDSLEESELGFGDLLESIVDFVEDIFSNTCSPLEFTIPFVDYDMSLPCMSTIYTTYAPTLFTLYQLITTGLIAYRVILNLFNKVHQLEDPNYDKVEVINL